jgi:hypothetical protein
MSVRRLISGAGGAGARSAGRPLALARAGGSLALARMQQAVRRPLALARAGGSQQPPPLQAAERGMWVLVLACCCCRALIVDALPQQLQLQPPAPPQPQLDAALRYATALLGTHYGW